MIHFKIETFDHCKNTITRTIYLDAINIEWCVREYLTGVSPNWLKFRRLTEMRKNPKNIWDDENNYAVIVDRFHTWTFKVVKHETDK